MGSGNYYNTRTPEGTVFGTEGASGAFAGGGAATDGDPVNGNYHIRISEASPAPISARRLGLATFHCHFQAQ